LIMFHFYEYTLLACSRLSPELPLSRLTRRPRADRHHGAGARFRQLPAVAGRSRQPRGGRSWATGRRS
jgi:hypothetical protein